MSISKIKWCCDQSHGVQLIEPNKELSQAYLKMAKEELIELKNAQFNRTKINHAYYAMYNSVYALLQKIGIKSEIHSCTFLLLKRYLVNELGKEDINYIPKAHKIRNQSTYYTTSNIQRQQVEEMQQKATEIYIKCKQIIPKIREEKIREIRKEINGLI